MNVRFLVLCCVALVGMVVLPAIGTAGNDLIHHSRGSKSSALMLEDRLRPFYHGVASGDPLPNSIIIWTRVTPETDGVINGNWFVSSDSAGANILQQGAFSTDATRDYTVKIEVYDLLPSTTYYYWFSALGRNSLIGRMRTAAVNAQHARFAVVSCNSYPHGFFNAFGRIAARNDLDAVIHLGDYIYEYGNTNSYGSETGEKLGRLSVPPSEIVKLADYRTRYSQYRLDPDFRAAHQQQTFITIWDDHEFANDAYIDGAENHTDATEGDWNERISVAKKAYFEWLPVREGENGRIYRSFSYGELLELIMLDTRIEGRQKQAENGQDPTLNDTNRTLLGQQQLQWLADEITGSSSRWKIIGNQVIFAPVEVAALGAQAVDLFLDVWNGYPAERRKIMDVIKNTNTKNVAILTGDFHTAFVFDVPDNLATYRATGEGTLAVEFAVPSVSSANFDENLYSIVRGTILLDPNIPDAVKENPTRLDSAIRATVQTQLTQINGGIRFLNPHLKEMQLTEHGYLLVDVTPSRLQGEFYFVDTILARSTNERFAFGFISNENNNKLVAATAPAAQKAVQERQAPAEPRTATSVAEEQTTPVLLNFYPNPAKSVSYCTFAVTREDIPVSLGLYDNAGKLLKQLSPSQKMQGVYTLIFDFDDVPSGVYYLRLQQGNSIITRMVLVSK